jgi:hypothetical protein
MTNRGLSQEENLKKVAQSMKMIDDGKWTEKNGNKCSELVLIGVGLKKADGGRERKTQRHEGMEDPQGSILRWQIARCSFLALSALERKYTKKDNVRVLEEIGIRSHVTNIALVHKQISN